MATKRMNLVLESAMPVTYLDFHAPRDDRDFRSGLIRSAGGNPEPAAAPRNRRDDGGPTDLSGGLAGNGGAGNAAGGLAATSWT